MALYVNGKKVFNSLVVDGDTGGSTPVITDLIPTPTTSASTEPFADSYYSSAQVDMRPWCAFDKTLTNYWASADGTNHYIGYKFASAVVVNRISMQLRIDDPSFSLGQAPIRWVVEGSNDDGTTWETVNESGYYWASYQDSHIYDFENTTAYKWWRVRATAVQNGQRIFGLAELGFYNVSYADTITYKNYLKFNGYGIILPWTLNSDYKIEVVFHETTYLQDSAIIGNTRNETRSNLTEYNNAYFTSTGTSGSGFGSWSAGEHTFITNNGNGKNEFDGVEVTDYTPTTDSTINYAIGWRATAGNAFKGWIKSYKVYSISSGDLLHELKPAVVMNSPCLYDTIDGKIYSTSLVEAVDTVS